MFRSLRVFMVCLLGVTTTLLAQQPSRHYGQRFQANGRISGTVYDEVTHQPIEYANIILFTNRDSSQVTGTITNPDGKFYLKNIRPGNFFIAVKFIGYKSKEFSDISIRPGNSDVSLGDIQLQRSAISTEGLVVEGKKPPIEYKIDRKVIDVSQQSTTISGTAVDVLETVPSVRVDIEGNVSLRGSSNFTVLIDGHPTVMDGSDALQQIPVSSIKNIEIITNPSAKYDPDGTAGIINVVLKKEKFSGSSGMLSLNAGFNQKYSGDALYNYKTDKYTVTLNADYGKRYFDGTQLERRMTSFQSDTSHIESNGSNVFGRNRGGVRGAFEYHFDSQNQLTLNGRYGHYNFKRESNSDFREWSSAFTQINQYTNTSNHSRDGIYYSVNADYLHQFNTKGHELTANLDYHTHDGNGTTLNELLNKYSTITSGQKSKETGPSSEYQFKVEYVYPHGKNRKFEAGYETESNQEDQNNSQFFYDTTQTKYVYQPLYSIQSRSSRNTQSIYSLYSGEINQFGYQLGIRGEYTYRNIARPDSGEFFHLNRWDYFPSLHLSYSFAGTQQIMASYSRRIDRPRGWHLEPFITWVDAYTVRKGNPALIPEYIDSYELGYQTRLGPSFFNFDTYYRVTHNKIEHIQSVYAENVTLESIDNIGSDYSLGGEVNLRYDVLKRWNVNLMGDFYHYRVTGSFLDNSFNRTSFNWGSRLSNTFKLGKAWQVQLDGMYHSPSVSSQGRRESFFRSNMAIRKDFMNRKLSAILQIRDIFGTSKRESTSSGPGFSTYYYRDFETPIVMFTLKLNINNYKENRRQGQNGVPGGIPDDTGGFDQ